MTRRDFQLLEDYMRQCTFGSAHDREHVYRVLYQALMLAQDEPSVDYDLLQAACLLHDIAREAERQDPTVCHARQGAVQAEAFLLAHGFAPTFARQVADCIRTHRFRRSDPPVSLEAKLLFDADKLDVTGAMGVARTLLYAGQTDRPLYSLTNGGQVSDGQDDEAPSFFQEYHFKLARLTDRFYTQRGRAIAAQRQQAAADFYHSLLQEVQTAYDTGRGLLRLDDPAAE